MNLEALQKTTRGFFPEKLGVRFLAVSNDEIRAEMSVPRELCTLPGRLHGGAIMGFADTLGAYATAINLPEGTSTTTLESKTNFFSAGIEGGKIIGVCTALHRGRSTMVWQTHVERDDGKRVALVTQTQMILFPQRSPADQFAALFAERDADEQRALLAQLERAGGGLYRHWADSEPNPERAAALRVAAQREDDNAELLELGVETDGG